MAFDKANNFKIKWCLGSSENFLQHMVMRYERREMHSALEAKEITAENQSCSSKYSAKNVDIVKDKIILKDLNFKSLPKVIQEITTNETGNVVSSIASQELSTNLSYNLDFLIDLQQKCERTPELYEEIIASGSLVHYAERLLFNYNNVLQYPACYTITNKDLSLLIAMLQLLTPKKDMAVHTIREIFINQSDVLVQLMLAVIKCSYNMVFTLNKLHKSTADKVLAWDLLPMMTSELSETFVFYFGINLSAISLQLEGFHGIQYDPVERPRNMHAEILKSHPKDGRKVTCLDEIHLSEEYGNIAHSDVIVARILLPKCAFIYTNSSWNEQLLYISGLLQTEIVTQMEKHEKLNIGDIYGLNVMDVTFQGTPSLVAPCLRGQLLTEISGWVMLWILDVGLLGFVPVGKIYFISSQEVLTTPPLIKLCMLEGAVKEAEEKFLEVAFKLLRIILETNTHTGKYMLLCEYGESLFSLLQYPKAQIRIALLDLLKCLARNDEDIASFMEEQHFDKALLGKLESYGHAYAAGLYKCKTTMETEIKYMVSILLAMLEKRKEISSCTENDRVIRVLTMFMNDACHWMDVNITALSSLKEELAKEKMQRIPYFRSVDCSYNRGQGRGSHQRIQHHNWIKKREERYEDSFCINRNLFKKNKENGLPQKMRINVADETEQNSYFSLANGKIEDLAKPMRHRKPYLNLKCQKCGWYNRIYKDYCNNAILKQKEEQFEQYNINKTNAMQKHVVEVKTDPVDARPSQINCLENELACFNRLDTTDNEQKYATAVYTDLEGNTEELRPSLDKLENARADVDMNIHTGMEYVIRESRVTIQPDETHAFIIARNMKELKEIYLAQVLCGLLNNNVEGFVYFGLTINSIIEGIRIGRSDKDTFRNGIDRIMHRCLIPEMRAHSYDIIFTPVISKEDTTTDLSNHCLYLIELQVRPMLHTVYTVYQGRKCCIRRGTETVEYNVMQKKQDMLNTEDKQIEECIDALNISAMKDLAALATFVRNFLPKAETQNLP